MLKYGEKSSRTCIASETSVSGPGFNSSWFDGLPQLHLAKSRAACLILPCDFRPTASGGLDLHYASQLLEVTLVS